MIGRPVFTTREIAALRGASISATSQGLSRLEAKGLLSKPTRGIWCVPYDPRFSRLSLVPYLAGSHPAYVSFVSALHLHGLVQQIPQVIYAATTGHSRVRQTPLGTFSYHRISPEFFLGYGWYGDGHSFLVADLEKAVVDSFYVSSRKGNRFSFFPELDLPQSFSWLRAREWVERIRDPMIRAYSEERLVLLEDSLSN